MAFASKAAANAALGTNAYFGQDEANALHVYKTAAATTGVVPDFVGQIFITDAGVVYIAKGITADTDWVQVSN